MKRLVMIGFVCATVTAFAMPTRKDLAKAQEMVNDVTSADLKALKAKTKTPSEVAAAHMALAEKASSEAEKYLLLQGAFNLYAKAGEYDSAANALEAMVRDIPEMRPDVIVEIYNKAIFRSMKDKAPRLYAIKEAARKAAANRRRLPALAKAAKAKPQDASVQKALGECQAELGNWDKALAAFAKAGGQVAEIAKSESNGTAKPQELADFWWDYGDDSSAYKLHAAAFYREALSDDSFNGLARERAERRIKEIESDDGASIANLSLASKATGTAKLPSFKGGETVKLTLDRKQNMELEFAGIPSGEIVIGSDDSWKYKKHSVRLTYPFLIMKYPITYAQVKSLDANLAAKTRSQYPAEIAKNLPDDLPAAELTYDEMVRLGQLLNERVAKNSKLRAYANYEFRLATEAEWAKADCEAIEGLKGSIEKWWRPHGVKFGKYTQYPVIPSASLLREGIKANSLGVFYGWKGTIFVDTYRNVLDGDKDAGNNTLHHLRTDIFGYEEMEVNPVRICSDANACRITSHTFSFHPDVRGIAGKSYVKRQDIFRFVYAPKLSLLNVYPRTAADGPLKSHDGKVIAPTKGAAQAKPLSFDLGSGIKLQLAHCPAGKFTMSNAPGGPDEKGTHEVKITRAYWIAPTRVTREMYKAFEADYDKDEKAKGEKKPGDFVTGRARAEAFATWLNGKFKAKLPRGYVFRLPTEAEWEHAQQAGAIDKNYDFEGTLDTAKAIAKKANAWRFENSVMSYAAAETDPLRLCELNPAWVCRQNIKRFLLPFDGAGTFRLAVGPDLLAEKKK